MTVRVRCARARHVSGVRRRRTHGSTGDCSVSAIAPPCCTLPFYPRVYYAAPRTPRRTTASPHSREPHTTHTLLVDPPEDSVGPLGGNGTRGGLTSRPARVRAHRRSSHRSARPQVVPAPGTLIRGRPLPIWHRPLCLPQTALAEGRALLTHTHPQLCLGVRGARAERARTPGPLGSSPLTPAEVRLPPTPSRGLRRPPRKADPGGGAVELTLASSTTATTVFSTAHCTTPARAVVVRGRRRPASDWTPRAPRGGRGL